MRARARLLGAGALLTLGACASSDRTVAVPARTAAPSAPTATPRGGGLLVGAYYYPWYDRTQQWDQGYIEPPALGRYSSRAAATIGQHISWARQFGIDFFAASWAGPQSYTDVTLHDYYLPQAAAAQVPIALLYEVRARFKGDRIDFDDAANRALLARDFDTMAQRYFAHPAYLKLGGRPVAFIYLTRIFAGDYAAAVAQLREAVQRAGHAVFLVADEVYWGSVNRTRAALFDAVTAYNMHQATIVEDDFDGFLGAVDGAYARWRAATDALPGTAFVPNAMPGFDDAAVRPEAHHPRLTPSPERFRAFLDLALRHLDPKLPLLMVTSFNEWHEDTQVEPGERYGTRLLETLHDALVIDRPRGPGG